MVSVLYLEINLMAVLLVLFIRFKTLGISKMVSQRNFSNAIDAQVVFFLSDTAAALIVLGALPFSHFGLMAAKTVYFFKSINDTYGHIQGDAALCRIADALRQSCGGLARRANIARYGGDEFVVLVSAESPSVVDALTERIHDTLARLNEKARAPYALSVSVGVATARRGESLKDALDVADRRLYEAKKKS